MNNIYHSIIDTKVIIFFLFIILSWTFRFFNILRLLRLPVLRVEQNHPVGVKKQKKKCK